MTDVVVLGAGPTGLATAMLLARRGLDIVVLDRDEGSPDDPESAWERWDRRGVTQFRQAHVLLGSGTAILEEHLPAVAAHLDKVGARRLNVDQRIAELLPGGAADVDFPFEAVTCRRPLIDHAFTSAARSTPGVDIRHGSPVTELVTGPRAAGGVPHVVGVRTQAGEVARLVVDASGRRTRLPAMLEAAGGRRPPEPGVEIGFSYSTQFYRGAELPEITADLVVEVGSFSALTIPADNGWWSVTLYYSAGDKLMRKVRDPQVFERVVRSLPLQAHWADGQAQGPVRLMTSSTNTAREFIVDGRPCGTGVISVGDAWGFTNPTIGRGITLGLMHALDIAPVVAAHLDDPVRLAGEWGRATFTRSLPWHTATVEFDRMRGPEMEAFHSGEPDPFDPTDRDVANTRAFVSACHYDAQVLAWFAEMRHCATLPAELFAREGVPERVREVAGSNPVYKTPGPDRSQLEALLA